VVLVPFLLSTAVFSRLAVMDLNLPAQQSAVEQLKGNDLQLEVVMRRDALEVGDRIGGLIQRIPRGAEHTTRALGTLMLQVKAASPTRPKPPCWPSRDALRPPGAGDGRGALQLRPMGPSCCGPSSSRTSPSATHRCGGEALRPRQQRPPREPADGHGQPT
jgi:hypothetical protein